VSQIHPERCSDDSITASESAHVNINRFTVPRDPLSIITATALALSIAVNIWCGWIIRDVGTLKWLHDWDLNQFENKEFAELKIKVETDDALIRAFGPQSCAKPTASR
jgi:hypothetical protein